MTLGITQENGSWTRYHPRKQLLATVSPKKTGHQHLTKHFPPTYHPRYHPRKQLLATVSPKKNRPPALDETFPTYVLPKVSPKKTIARYCITQENRPMALDETFPNYVSPKKTGPGHGITQENKCWLLYDPRKQATGT